MRKEERLSDGEAADTLWISKLSEGRGIWVNSDLHVWAKCSKSECIFCWKALKKTKKKHFPVLASTFPNVFLSIDT